MIPMSYQYLQFFNFPISKEIFFLRRCLGENFFLVIHGTLLVKKMEYIISQMLSDPSHLAFVDTVRVSSEVENDIFFAYGKDLLVATSKY